MKTYAQLLSGPTETAESPVSWLGGRSGGKVELRRVGRTLGSAGQRRSDDPNPTVLSRRHTQNRQQPILMRTLVVTPEIV